MSKYAARYGHEDNCTPGILSLNATTDREAIAEIRQFVADGVRNGTWAATTLSDGRAYVSRNEHGKAV